MPVHATLQRSQRGIALVVSLIMLLVLTLIGVTAMQLSTRQEKMAGNTRDLDLAFQAAEAGLRFGEFNAIESGLPEPTELPTGWYHIDTAPAPRWANPAMWNSSPTMTYPLHGDFWDVAQTPQVAVEDMGLFEDPNGSLGVDVEPDYLGAFRVSARGFGGGSATQVILQSTVVQRR
jgi:type IV pilus assembly protein PilX